MKLFLKYSSKQLEHGSFRINECIKFGTRKRKMRDRLFFQSIRDVNYVAAVTLSVRNP